MKEPKQQPESDRTRRIVGRMGGHGNVAKHSPDPARRSSAIQSKQDAWLAWKASKRVE